MNKKFVIFDMDGTLIDSMKYWEGLAEEYLRSKGVESDLTETLSRIETMTMSESAAFFTEKYSLCISAQTAADEMNEMIESHYKNDIPLKNGVGELLDDLKRQGVRMCTASATAEHLVRACFLRLGILEYFEFILSCETLNTSKRDPYIYLKAAELFGAEPCETAVYEDALYALKTAKNAGFYTVAVYDESSASMWNELEKEADEILKN